MKQKVLDFIMKNKLLDNNDSVVLGVSGGADSICMLRILRDLRDDLGISLYVLHVNHQIRGEEANRDAKFVIEMCNYLNVPYRALSIDVPAYAKSHSLSLEEAGRQVRYNEMENYAKEVGATKIAVAHNKNDSAETVLLNLARGTGIRGLGGIALKRPFDNGYEKNRKQIEIIRPIRCLTRDEIEQYLGGLGQGYCNDSTNESTEYTRNKIRLEILPKFAEVNANALSNISNASDELSDIADFIEHHVDEAYEKYVDVNMLDGKAYKLDNIVLSGVIRKMIESQAGSLKDITRVHVNDVMALFDKAVGKRVDLPYGLIAERDYMGIFITRADNRKNPWDKGANSSLARNGTIKTEIESDDFDRTNITELKYTKWMDYDKINNVRVRTRMKGDFIVIDAYGRTKKLKDYFIDEKIPRGDRDKVLLVADGNHILWVVGYRISEAVKVTPQTRKVVKFTYVEE